MGLFQNFRKAVKETQSTGNTFSAAACLSGHIVPMEKLPDPAFAEGILGPCAGIEPPEDAGECRILSPADGTVTQCSETGHAVGLACRETEILVHAGIDTVQMAGRGFSLSVKPGENVKTGQPLLVMDAAMVRAAGYSPVVVTVVTDTPGKISFSDKTEIHGGETLFTVSLP